ncbi:MAG TPA: YkgJ family cysteine cluster protein [Cyclobacteriaceae bacterium]|nr:YkgJ family cysteine cluster protein [Cyclobacteriaceae bacterium]
MELPEKVRATEEVFKKLDAEIASFRAWSGVHCKTGCGKCCFKPDIEATVLEFLPFAHHLWQHNLADVWLDKIKSGNAAVCYILNPTQAGAGLCAEYPHRGLICRLFGYSARTTKYAAREYVTCQVIKTEQTGNHQQAAQKVSQGSGEIPMMNQYYMQLHSIDMDLTREFYPINEAIKRAIETVLAWYAYR